jgi:hypothetical protein
MLDQREVVFEQDAHPRQLLSNSKFKIFLVYVVSRYLDIKLKQNSEASASANADSNEARIIPVKSFTHDFFDVSVSQATSVSILQNLINNLLGL